jgi:hypothetical protein
MSVLSDISDSPYIGTFECWTSLALHYYETMADKQCALLSCMS